MLGVCMVRLWEMVAGNQLILILTLRMMMKKKKTSIILYASVCPIEII